MLGNSSIYRILLGGFYVRTTREYFFTTDCTLFTQTYVLSLSLWQMVLILRQPQEGYTFIYMRLSVEY